MANLASRMVMRDYIRISEEIVLLAPHARILDWGCGYGQMSWLLLRHGLGVTSYDVGAAADAEILPFHRDLNVIVGKDPVRLPFSNSEFDAVLSCGVFEHVPDEEGSLAEIHRVLRPGGLFLLYNLPNRYSYKEFLLERLHLGYSHERKYTVGTIRPLLQKHGFRVTRSRRGGMLPHMLSGIPSPIGGAYERAASVLYPVDRLLSRAPLMNSVAEALEILAQVAP
ncbi:MAG: class I SAM-dependent methyltransferase [Rudaea sp.]